MRIDETYKAYLAGIIDGEGCLNFDGALSNKFRLVVGNNHKGLIEKLQRDFGGSVFSRLGEGRRQRNYLWTFHGAKAIQLLHECYPYLIVKRKHADIVFKMAEGFSKKRITEEEAQRRMKLIALLTILNQHMLPGGVS